jgi:hypothetical protein
MSDYPRDGSTSILQFPWAKLQNGNPFDQWEPDNPPPDEESLDAAYEWLAAPFVLQRPQNSAFNKFAEDCPETVADEALHNSHLFLMTHDWAGAFAGDADFDDRTSEFRLPAPNCCFDFLISGKRVLAFANDTENEFDLAVEVETLWLVISQETSDGEGREVRQRESLAFVRRHVKAACIALEAEIAETTVVRAPHKLNVARARKGKLPLSDYHIIDLARRTRVAPLESENKAERNGPRLHFRRGHWRHFTNHKTWVKWTLVGHADLGFIDKDYRL